MQAIQKRLSFEILGITMTRAIYFIKCNCIISCYFNNYCVLVYCHIPSYYNNNMYLSNNFTFVLGKFS